MTLTAKQAANALGLSPRKLYELADDMENASKLLQHSSVKMTETHYRTKPTKLKAVR